MNRSFLLRTLLLACGALLPSFAFAHTGIGVTGGFMHGYLHPFSGLDHVCAMLAVGLWAVQQGGRKVWIVPLTFVAVMALGGVLPMLGVGLPFAEQGIALSVLLLGVLIAASIRLPLWLGSSLVGLFALWHGHAHGAEMPALESGMAYGAGFLLATGLLHVAGIAAGYGMQRAPVLGWTEGARERIVRMTGAGIALVGVYLAVA